MTVTCRVYRNPTRGIFVEELGLEMHPEEGAHGLVLF